MSETMTDSLEIERPNVLTWPIRHDDAVRSYLLKTAQVGLIETRHRNFISAIFREVRMKIVSDPNLSCQKSYPKLCDEWCKTVIDSHEERSTLYQKAIATADQRVRST